MRALLLQVRDQGYGELLVTTNAAARRIGEKMRSVNSFRYWWWVPLPSVVMIFILMRWAELHGAAIDWPWVGVAGIVALLFGWLICWLGRPSP